MPETLVDEYAHAADQDEDQPLPAEADDALLLADTDALIESGVDPEETEFQSAVRNVLSYEWIGNKPKPAEGKIGYSSLLPVMVAYDNALPEFTEKHRAQSDKVIAELRLVRAALRDMDADADLFVDFIQMKKDVRAGFIARKTGDGEVTIRNLSSAEQKQIIPMQDRVSELVKKGTELNLRLVIKRAWGFTRKYFNNLNDYHGRNEFMADLHQDGVEGLMRAVYSLDPSQGAISTYSDPKIARQIIKGQYNDRMVHIPVYLQTIYNSIKRHEAALTRLLGREPTQREVLEVLAEDPDNAITAEQYHELLQHFRQTTSYETMLADDDGEKETRDPLPDSSVPVHVVVHNSQLATEMRSRLAELLSPRELSVLVQHHGLNGRDPLPYDQMVSQMGISRQAIRKIGVRAEAKIVQNGVLEDLKAHLEP